MMSSATIAAIAEEAGEQARNLEYEPYFIEPGHEWEKDRWPPFPFPNLGNYRPRGWKMIDDHMADSSGFGREDEPAFTPEQLKRWCEAGYGYGIVECGEFQVVIGKFKKVN